MIRTIKKASRPDTLIINDTILKNNVDADLQGYPHTNRQKHNIAAELKAQGLTVCIVEVLSRNLKGKTDLHNQPYKPSVFIYSDLHTAEQINKWRQDVEFWKKLFAPRTKKWMVQTKRKNSRPKVAELWTGNEAAQNQAIKELLNN